MLQRRFIDGLFDPALQQLLRLHARTDDFVTTVTKARQYIDAQEQAKITAISKKPNGRFAGSNPYLMDSSRCYRRSWTIRTGHLRLMLVKRHPGMEDPRREKQKVTGHSYQLLVMPPPAQSIQIPDTGNKSLEDDPVKLRLPDRETTISFLDVMKDAKAISLSIPPLPIASSDSRLRKEISKHEDPDGTGEFLQALQISVHEDRRTDLFVEDVTCVDN